MLNLIYNRTSADVNKVSELKDKIKKRENTLAELDEWVNSLKGAYNYTDLNRVGEAINYLANLLNKYAYYNNVVARTDWSVNEKPNPSQMRKYLEDVNTLRQTFYVKNTTPQTPSDMVFLTYKEANDIEKILDDIHDMIKRIENSFVYCGVPNCGQNRIWQKRFRKALNWYNLRFTIELYNQPWDTVSVASTSRINREPNVDSDVGETLNYWNYKLNEIDRITGGVY